MKTKSIASQIDTARKIIEALRQINPTLDIRGEAQDTINKKMERYNTVTNLLDSLDTQGTTLMNERNGILEYFRQLPVATREVIAGKYGKNSTEYELVGGTRTSEITHGGNRSKTAKKTTPSADGGAEQSSV